MTNSLNTKTLRQDFANKNILIIGDVMIDAYLWGNVERISPEAPIPIVSVNKRENRMGGAANVALNIAELGANPYLISVIGDDEKGKIFLDLLKKRNISEYGIIIDKHRKTTVKSRVISKNQHLLRVDDEISNPISEDLSNALFQKILDLNSSMKIDAIIFEDYDKGVISSGLISKITEFTTENNIITSVDPKKRNFDDYKNISLFKPNFKEFCEGLACEIDKTEHELIFSNAKEFMSNKNINYMFITLSEEGVFITDGQTWHHIPAERRDIADVSGAGDTAISVATLCLVANLNMYELAKAANLAGGLVCEKPGVVPINLDELIKALEI
ncbi:MAG: D-glycero-beta-D-manno-heptose-7-phosphate kinase [Bacteroidales bacterium]|nr:D-glycero-beta-D-manno-heptose-7-phosphate kinase [Bacteroidales bacterium]